MRTFKISALTTLAASFMLAATPLPAHASPQPNPQIGIGINIGPAPVCPYGYYGFAPYNCAPYGYYGPDWFTGGVFLGAGPWFHGPHDFRGHINNRFDPRHGYRGHYPSRGERAARPHDYSPHNFRGNQWSDGRGHTYSNGGNGHGRH